jgi:tetratricopeptide (TPR) repeat protein
LNRALELSKQADQSYVAAYTCTWLSWPCSELGRFDEAIEKSRKAKELFEQKRVKDPYIYFHALFGIGYAAWHKGDIDLTHKTGSELLRFGTRHGYIRSLVAGHCCHGWRGLITGDIDSATQSFNAASQLSTDPWYALFPKLALAYGLISNHKIGEALPLLDQLIEFSDENGAEFVGEAAYFFKGLASILDGQVQSGLESMETRLARWKRSGERLRCLLGGSVMANLYSTLHEMAGPNDILEGVPGAAEMARKSQQWYHTCIAEAEDMGAGAMHGRMLLGLGNLLVAMGKPDQARRVLGQSKNFLEQSRADVYLEKTEALLESIEIC